MFRFFLKSSSLIFILLNFFLIGPSTSFAQTVDDTTIEKELKELEITGYKTKVTELKQLPDIYGTYLIAGKKTEVVELAHQNSNVAEKTGRQIFSKIPGVFVYDMDGSGNQINIATRGLDPHRSWEFNIRQNDVMVISDIYGYPASHYSAPLEAVEKIELTRGTGALQYGGQFGGMINYKLKQIINKPFAFESINTVGSFGLYSTYNAIGGTYKKWKYYAYSANRHSEGYRKNGKSDYNAQFASIAYQANENLSFKAEIGRSDYTYQIPGPLNDSMFNANPRAATRSKNYYSPEIYVPSFRVNFNIGLNTKLELISSAVIGDRKSVQVTGNALSPDVISSSLGGRQVDIDYFNSYTTELRLLQAYGIGYVKSSLAAGVRLISNDMKRRQVGVGTSNSDADFSVKNDEYRRDMHFKTNNLAFYIENMFQLTDKWVLSPGLRFESGRSDFSGKLIYLDDNKIPNNIEHEYILGGVSTKYALNEALNFHSGFSQAYRPVLLKDIVPETTSEGSSKNLKDVTGYNAELGVNGVFGSVIKYDLTFFSLTQNDRMGTVTLLGTAGNDSLYYRTNVGDSKTNGVEFFLQWKIFQNEHTTVSFYTSNSYMDGRYTSGEMRDVNDNNKNKSLKDKKIETVPQIISRNGLDVTYKKFSLSLLYSYTDESFADPFNTVTPTKTGTIGLIPAYGLLDAGISYYLSDLIKLKVNASNLLNKQYFTKRPTLYPGPGIWPSDGRSFQLTFQVKI
jgi:Fe(3+) dicitrate transport protein